MSIDSVSALGLLGVQKGLQGAQASAAQIAGATGDANAMTGALVALKQHELQVAAAAETIKAADEMIGSLIDVFA